MKGCEEGKLWCFVRVFGVYKEEVKQLEACCWDNQSVFNLGGKKEKVTTWAQTPQHQQPCSREDGKHQVSQSLLNSPGQRRIKKWTRQSLCFLEKPSQASLQRNLVYDVPEQKYQNSLKTKGTLCENVSGIGDSSLRNVYFTFPRTFCSEGLQKLQNTTHER